jgi:hypothetical protein
MIHALRRSVGDDREDMPVAFNGIVIEKDSGRNILIFI